jgi:hypothetical protein
LASIGWVMNVYELCGPTVSFLNDLKKQADQVRADQNVDDSALQAHILATESACQLTFKYWIDLCKQLNVLQPASKGRYAFDNKTVFTGLKFTGYRLDIRNRPFGNRSVTDHVVLHCELQTGKTLALSKNFLTDIDKLQARITQSGVRCRPEEVRNPENGKLIEMRYEFEATIAARVLVQPQHDTGKLSFTLDNFEGLGRWVIEFDAKAINVYLLDELAKWMVGQPSTFRTLGRVSQVIDF